MRPPIAEIVRWTGMAVLAAPLLVLSAEFARLVREPPAGVEAPNTASALVPIGPLEAGDRRTVRLTPEEGQATELVAFLGTYHTTPKVVFELCAAERCVTSAQQVEDNSLVFLPLPAGAAGREVTVAVRSIDQGSLAYWSEGGVPVLRPSSYRGWSHPWSRAEASFRIMGGSGWGLLVGVNTVAFCGLLALAVWRARKDRDATPAASIAGPGDGQ